MSEMLEVKMPLAPEPEIEIKEVEQVEQEEQTDEEQTEEEDNRGHIPDDEVFADAPQVKKVKRKCSNKQLEHLKKCREKALAKKQADREFIEQQKEKQNRFRKQEEKLMPKPSKKPVKPKKVYYEEPEYENPEYQGQQYQYYEEPTAPPQQQVGMYQLSAEQIQELQRNAIADYETIRVDRVRQQREALNKQREQQALARQRQQVFGQMTSSAKGDDPWASAFNFN
jgi:hypothetical protein